MGNHVKFLGYRDILGEKYHDAVRMLWSRSSLFREFSLPLWLGKLNEFYLESTIAFNPDFVLSVKGETLLPKYMTKIRNESCAKIALWYPDDPRFFKSLTAHIAHYYDVVFTSSQRAINLYKSISVNNVYRLPFACDPEVHRGILDPQNLIRKALFIGTYSQKRYSFIRKLLKKGVPIDIIGSKWPFPFDKYVVGPSVLGSKYVSNIQSYSVILNIHQNLSYGPNMRTFEVTGSGGVLLSDRAEDITDFFSEGDEISVYDNLEDAAHKIKYLIENPDVSFEMSCKGQKRCYLYDTYDKRGREILKHLSV